MMIKDNCILCNGELISLRRADDPSDYHYRCSGCGHGWYIADLQNMAGMRLAGKTDEQIRSIIIKEDMKGVKDG